MHGLLTGAVSARAAADPRADVLADLGAAMADVRGAIDSQSYIDGAQRFRDIVIAGYAGPRLTATIRSSRSFIPWKFWARYDATRAHLLPIIEAEYAAIEQSQPAAARRACIDRADLMADLLIAELNRRGVFAGLDST